MGEKSMDLSWIKNIFNVTDSDLKKIKGDLKKIASLEECRPLLNGLVEIVLSYKPIVRDYDYNRIINKGDIPSGKNYSDFGVIIKKIADLSFETVLKVISYKAGDFYLHSYIFSDGINKSIFELMIDSKNLENIENAMFVLTRILMNSIYYIDKNNM